jgi:RNA polymerase sigma-70 factor (ECF subfamily)
MRESDDNQMERALLARIAAGDEDALHELYTRLRPRLWRYLWRQLGGDRPLIEDTVQEVFLAVWRSAGSFRNEARVITWVFQIARNLTLRARYAIARRTEILPQEDDVGNEVSDSPWRQESFEDAALDRVVVAEALRQLPLKHRETLELVFYGGFSLDEAAAIRGIPTGTVKSRISFARQALMRALRHPTTGVEHSDALSPAPYTKRAPGGAHHDA